MVEQVGTGRQVLCADCLDVVVCEKFSRAVGHRYVVRGTYMMVHCCL